VNKTVGGRGWWKCAKWWSSRPNDDRLSLLSRLICTSHILEHKSVYISIDYLCYCVSITYSISTNIHISFDTQNAICSNKSKYLQYTQQHELQLGLWYHLLTKFLYIDTKMCHTCTHVPHINTCILIPIFPYFVIK
jgi:hypothetical protein